MVIDDSGKDFYHSGQNCKREVSKHLHQSDVCPLVLQYGFNDLLITLYDGYHTVKALHHSKREVADP